MRLSLPPRAHCSLLISSGIKQRPIEDDGAEDVESYNGELRQLGSSRWFAVPWLYSECYLYRRLHSFLSQTKHWHDYDPFRAQKVNTFRASLAAVVELASRYKRIVLAMRHRGTDPLPEAEAEKLLFIEVMEICLWGNATDLSLLTSLTYEDIQSLQGSQARKAAEANILVNHLPRVFDVLQSARASGRDPRRLDIVLDNSGFELFVDLVLAGYLLEAGLATDVVLHPKSIPWFVSDVLPRDFFDLMNALADPVPYFSANGNSKAESDAPVLSEAQQLDLAFLHESWLGFHRAGKIRLRESRFWTLPGSYWRLPALDRELHEELRASELVVFKGDLNYRKLTGDAAWDPTTPFAEAIGPLGKPGLGVRALALRTCKGDVVVGLPEGRDEELKEGTVERKWGWNGKYAVVQFCDGRT